MRLIVFLFVVLATTPGFGQTLFKESDVQPGVSEKLAIVRKNTLSGINYKIALNIPAKKQDSIEATEVISLEIRKNERALQIDFKGKREQIKSLDVNDKQVPVVFVNEHIIVDPLLLKTGLNRISIVFIAGDMSLNRKRRFFIYAACT